MRRFLASGRSTPRRPSPAALPGSDRRGIDRRCPRRACPRVRQSNVAANHGDGRWIHEDHGLGASQPLGLADNPSDKLNSFNASLSYTFDNTWSLTAGRFILTGSKDPTFFGTFSGKPNSNGWIGEIASLPFMHGGPSFWPWLSARIGLQLTAYDKFDGARSNFNGLGRSAHANNTLFAYAWIMF